MPFAFPLKVRRFQGIAGKTSAYLITDAKGRSINVCCEETELRREVAKLWSPEEAEAIAKWIARRLTDDWAVQIRVHQNAAPTDRKR